MVVVLGRALVVPALGRVPLVLAGRELMVGRLETVGRVLPEAVGREVPETVGREVFVVVAGRPETTEPAVLGVVG